MPIFIRAALNPFRFTSHKAEAVTSFSGSLICRRVIFTSGSRYMTYLVQTQETHLFRLYISNGGGMQRTHSASCVKYIPSRFEPHLEQILAMDPQKQGI